jgi:glycosyltransferase involved in cell wall biosynthesis
LSTSLAVRVEVMVVTVEGKIDESFEPARLSVLHLMAPGAFGGLERVVESLSGGRAARGGRTGLVAILDRGAPAPAFLQRLRSAGAEVEVVVSGHRAYRAERAAVRAVLMAWRPDVVHTHGYHPDVLLGGVARSLGAPVVSTTHGFTGGGRKNRLFEWLQERALRRFDAVIAVSRPLVSRLQRAGVPSERIHLIPNAWAGDASPLARPDARAALGLGSQGFLVGWVGRLSPEKGPDVALQALARIPDQDLHLVVIGDGRQAASLRRLAASLGVAGRVDWAGGVQDAARLFAAFDAFCLSSRTEGTPMVLFEAMAARVPIAATAVGGIPDVLTNTEALLVPSEDPAALAAAIAEIRRAPEAAAARAEAAAGRLARDRGLEPWLDRHEELYHRLATPHPHPVS